MPTLDNTVLSFSLGTTENNALDLNVIATAALAFNQSMGFSSGTAAGQVDRIIADTRTIAASGNDDLDLNGVLTDLLGGVVSLLRVKVLVVRASAANVNNVVVGGGASNPFINWATGTTPAVVVRPGGLFVLAASDATGYAVTAATGDILRITNSGAGSSVTYDIVILGASA
jgi:hypothetical protein